MKRYRGPHKRVTVRSYRYAWAERAEECGLPEGKTVVNVPPLDGGAKAHVDRKLYRRGFMQPAEAEAQSQQQ